MVQNLKYIKMIDCLEGNIIGLSQDECNCFDDDRPTDYSESLSGLYLTELIKLSEIKNIEDCENGSMWDIMKQSIKDATRLIEDEILKCINGKVNIAKNACFKPIGALSYSNTITQTTTYAGIKLTLWNIQGACMVLKGLKSLFDTNGVLNGHIIFSNFDSADITFPINTMDLVALENQLVTALEVYQYSEYCDEIEVYVVYEVDPNIKPYNNRVDCGCKDSECYMEYVKAEGIEGNDLETIMDWNSTSTANGLILETEFKCKEKNVICDGQTDWDSSFGRNIARAIQYLSAYKVFEHLYYSNDPSILTTVCKEDLETRLPRLEAKYKEYIKFLCEGIDLENSDCFVCKENWDIKHAPL